MSTEIISSYLKDYVGVSKKSFDYNQSKKIEIVKTSSRLVKFNLNEAKKVVPIKILRKAFYQFNDISENHKELDDFFLEQMNTLESLSAPLVSGVADSDSAFNSIGRTFCDSVESLWFNYVFYRSFVTDDCNYFPSTIKLYDIWKSKIEKSDLERKRSDVEEQILKITKQEIKPIGT